MRYLIIFLVFVYCISCSSSARNAASEGAYYTETVVLSSIDTLRNGGMYEAKVYFENPFLFEQAKKNGINDYFFLSYESNVDGNQIFIPIVTQTAEVINDTAYIEFIATLDSLETGEVEEFCWFFRAEVDYTKDRDGIDTTFSSMNCFYVIGQE